MENTTRNALANETVAELRRRLKVAEDALKDALSNLDAWVYGGRFAIAESDVDAIRKIKEALKLIAEEGGEA